MARILIAFAVFASAGALRDVPVGECHACEVTCFEDCMLKYDREIIQADLLQTPAKVNEHQHVEKLTEEYTDCLKEDKCPCKKEELKAKNGKALLQKKNATCAVGDVPCAQKCSQKVVSNAETKLKGKPASKKQALLQRDYPIHSVTIGVFSKGHMDMDQCLKFCLAATCGCDKAPGLDTIDKLFKAIKENDAAAPGEKDFTHKTHAVADTHQSAKFRPAKIEECAKGMIGKKVAEDLYIDMGEGIGGEYEVCTKKFMEKVFGPGDHSKKLKLCKSTKSTDTKWGCIWNDTKGYCMVGFAETLRCQVKYFNDPSRF